MSKKTPTHTEPHNSKKETASSELPTKRYPIQGMHCDSCASIIEKTLRKVPGVESCSVNYGTEKAELSFDPQQT